MMDVLEMATRLVAVESVSRLSNRPIVDLISQFCEDAGCAVSHFSYNKDQQTNIVATKGGSDPYLALSSHTDTVGFREKDWKTSPLELTYKMKKGKVYYHGLGIADMKLAIATSIAAVSTISSTELGKPVGLYFTAQEEIGCIGVKQLVGSGVPISPYVVVCEPTEMVVANRHKGYIYFSVTVSRNYDEHDQDTKLWTHSSDDRKTTNILESVLPLVLQGLVDVKDHLRTIVDPRFNPPYTTVNIGQIKQSEDASKNIIPTSFTLHCDARPIPSMNHHQLLRLIESQVTDTVASLRITKTGEGFSVKVKAERQTTPFLISEVDDLFSTALGDPELKDVPYNTEGKLYDGRGSQVVVMGPGNIHDAHHKNEFVSERWLQTDIAERYISIIRAMCGRRS